MRLLIIIDHLNTDAAGTENQVVKVALVCLRDSAWFSGARASFPCNTRVFNFTRVSSLSFWTEAWKLRRYLKERRPDVVHTFFPVANIWGVLCARLAGVKAIVASRRDYGHWMNSRYLFVTRLANHFVSRIVSNSEQVGELTTRVEKYPAERIEVIYNGVELANFNALQRNDALKAQIGIPAHHKVITLVGNVRAIKRHDTLVHAAKAMLATRSDFTLLFVGKDNGNMAEVVSLIEAEGLADRVVWAHADGNVHEYLSFSDIGVNCSESEGLSNAVIECMAARVPCIVSEGGGNIDLIQHEVNGLTFPVGDHLKLAAALERMFDDDALRQLCVEASVQKVQVSMSLPAVLDRFDRFYRELTADLNATNRGLKALAAAPGAVARKVAYKLATVSPVIGALHSRVSARGATVFMYHEIGADRDQVEAWQVVRRSDFLRQVDYLRKHYEVLPLDEAMKREAFRGNRDDGGKPVAVLTFDDGNRGMIEHLMPILQREALPATVYVATGHIERQSPYWFDRVVNALQHIKVRSFDLSAFGLGHHHFTHARPGARWLQIQELLTQMKRLSVPQCEAVATQLEQQALPGNHLPPLSPMTIDQVIEMARNPMVTLGAHSHGHEILTRIPIDEARRSIQQSIDLLLAWTGQSVKHFAYPSGFVNQALQEILPGMGIETAVAGCKGLWTERSSAYAIPRIAVGRYDTLEKFKAETVLGLRGMMGNLIRPTV
jgi:glycosyltransferase involved in cell wall biosynthesis/peptidoglycan/xylan/chitin deacetylase (PgdA/CDA1 family)